MKFIVPDSVTQDFFRRDLSYNPITGRFRNLKTDHEISNIKEYRDSSNKANIRCKIKFLGKKWKASKVAWFLMTGSWPTDLEIDHINRDPMDNRWENLRLVTRSENLKNRAPAKFRATNDYLIYDLLQNPIYKVLENGTILTSNLKNGSPSDKWREVNQSTDCSPDMAKAVNKTVYRIIGYKKTRLRVHRIIYAAFIGPLSEDMVVNHKDGDSSNNKIENLELVSPSQNNLHSVKVLNNNRTRQGKLPSEAIESIRMERNLGSTIYELSAKYGRSISIISRIVNRVMYPE